MWPLGKAAGALARTAVRMVVKTSASVIRRDAWATLGASGPAMALRTG
jgi:hypothetical protein